MALAMTNKIYDITTLFPKEEMFGLTSQLRRSTVSIASNIAEGSARGGSKEFIQFLYIARGSVAEIETQIEIALMRRYCNQQHYQEIRSDCGSINRMLFALQKALQAKH